MGAGAYRVIEIFGFASFFAELFVILLIFMRHAEKRRYFWLRLPVVCAAAVPLKFFPTLRIGIFGMSYFIIAAMVFLAGLFLYRTTVLNSVFYVLAAYASQHIAWDVFVIFCEIVGRAELAAYFALYISSYVLIYGAIFLLFSFRQAYYEVKSERLAVVVMSALIIFVTCVLCDLIGAYDRWTYFYRIYAMICCALALATQFGVFERGKLRAAAAKLERDKEVLGALLSQEKKQQELSRETIEVIEMKCHDLKQQISTLRGMDAEERDKRIGDIEKAVMIYGNIAKTGNAALDVVLTEKCLLCEKYKIKFTYIADGQSLDAFDPVDVSSLFGNAIDNAIECVSRYDEEKRIIRLNVSTTRGYLRIRLENYCGHEVEFDGGLPVTSKPDKAFHGFGVRSIKFIAEKCGGSLVVGQDGELFTLNVLLPLSRGGAMNNA